MYTSEIDRIDTIDKYTVYTKNFLLHRTLCPTLWRLILDISQAILVILLIK